MNCQTRLHGFLRTAFPLIGIAVVQFILSCSHRSPADTADFESVNRRFSSLVTAGDFDRADSLIREERARGLAEGDSDGWCASKVHESVLYFYLCQPEKMLAAGDSASAWLDRHPETPSRLLMHQKVLQAKGTVYTQFNFNPDSAVYYLKRGADLAERSGDRKEFALALANLADAYKLNSRLDMAAEYYHRAILEADTAGFAPQDYISLYGGLATVYTGLRDFDKSKLWWEKTMKLKPLMIPYEKFNNLNNYGTDFYYRKDYTGALNVFRSLNAWLDSLPSAEWERNFVAVNLADCYLHLNQPDSVAELLPKAHAYFTEVQPNPVALSYLHTLMMRRDFELGDNAGVERLIAAHPFSDTLRPEMQMLRLEFLSDYYHKTGRSDRAYTTYRQLSELEDSIRSVAVSQSIAATAMAYERDRDLLELRTANAEQQTRIFRLFSIVVLAAIILGVVIWLVIAYRRRSLRREEKMLSKIGELRSDAARSRITPHFIYNTLNHEINNRNAGRKSRLEAIVSLLRYQQFVAADIVTTLKRELDFTDSYIAVSSDNYPDRLDYRLEIGEGLDPARLRMPSMFIQILVENAFKHSFSVMPPDTVCRLRIRVEERGDRLVEVSVYNNAPMEAAPTKGSGTGMRVIMETIKILRERENVDIQFKYRLNINNGEETGFLATYLIPKDWMETDGNSGDSPH